MKMNKPLLLCLICGLVHTGSAQTIYWYGSSAPTSGSTVTMDLSTADWDAGTNAARGGGSLVVMPNSSDTRWDGSNYTVNMAENMELDSIKNFIGATPGTGMTFDLQGNTLTFDDGGNNIQSNGQDIWIQNGTVALNRNTQISIGNVVGQADHTVTFDAPITSNPDVGVDALVKVAFGTLLLNSSANSIESLIISNGDLELGSSAFVDVNTVTLQEQGTTGQFGRLVLNSATGISTDAVVSMTADNSMALDFIGIQTVGSLTIGGSSVTDGLYSAAELSGLGFGGTFTGTGSIGVGVIPEPSSVLLLLSGMGVLFVAMRQRR